MAFLGPQVKDAGSSKKSQSAIKLKEEGKQKFSRVLDEDIQSWMKKTTYLTNDPYRSVHRFKSLADTKKESAEAVEKKIEELAKARLDPSSIRMLPWFVIIHSSQISLPGATILPMSLWIVHPSR
jgi:hypothetical protein